MKEKRISIFAGFTELINEIGPKEAARQVKDCGFDAAELIYNAQVHGNIPSVNQANEYKNIFESEGLSISCVSCCATIVKEDSPGEVNQEVVNRLCECVDFAHAVGSPLLHHTLYFSIANSVNAKYEDVIEATVRGAKAVADYAKEFGITIRYEPQGRIFNGTNGFISFYRAIHKISDNTGVCLDVGNTYWVDEEPYELLEERRRDVKLVHLKDYTLGANDTPYKTSGGTPIKEVPTGHGIIDFERIIHTLDESGYDGYWSMEDCALRTMTDRISHAKAILSK